MNIHIKSTTDTQVSLKIVINVHLVCCDEVALAICFKVIKRWQSMSCRNTLNKNLFWQNRELFIFPGTEGEVRIRFHA